MTDQPDVPPYRFPLTYAPDIISVFGKHPQWSLVGGEESESALELFLVVTHPTEDMAARVRIVLPISAGDGVLCVGSPSVKES